MDEIEIRLTEREVARILWVLSEAADLAAAAGALAKLPRTEDTLRMCGIGSTAVVPSSHTIGG